mgnify:CR=1 FL=1
MRGEYDLKLPAPGLDQLFSRAGEDQAAAENAREVFRLDARLRAGMEAKYGYSQADQALLLGRPSWEVARAYGVFWPNQ